MNDARRTETDTTKIATGIATGRFKTDGDF